MLRKFTMIICITVLSISVMSASAFAEGSATKSSHSHKGKSAAASVSIAEAISMIVEGLDLNIDNLRFIKAPKVSDYYSNIPDDSPYAEDFIIAYHNGIQLARDIKPNASISRELFVHTLYSALAASGDYAWIDLFMILEDGEEITPEYMASVQRMLIAKIVQLEGNKFQPKKSVSLCEAQIMIQHTREYIDKQQKKDTTPNPNLQQSQDQSASSSTAASPAQHYTKHSNEKVNIKFSPAPKTEDPTMTIQPVERIPLNTDQLSKKELCAPQQEEVTMTVTKVNDDINKVELSWGEKGNSGYSITIDSIIFDHDEKQATIYYTLHYPDPDKMYLTVITEPKADTYISAEYEPMTASTTNVLHKINRGHKHQHSNHSK